MSRMFHSHYPTEDLIIALAEELGVGEPGMNVPTAEEAICTGLISGEVTIDELIEAVNAVFVNSPDTPNAEELGDALVDCLNRFFG